MPELKSYEVFNLRTGKIIRYATLTAEQASYYNRIFTLTGSNLKVIPTGQRIFWQSLSNGIPELLAGLNKRPKCSWLTALNPFNYLVWSL